MSKSNQASAIPPILSPSGHWCIQAADKAQAFATTFANKYSMPEPALNEYTDLHTSSGVTMSGFLPVRGRHAKQTLNIFGGTGVAL